MKNIQENSLLHIHRKHKITRMIKQILQEIGPDVKLKMFRLSSICLILNQVSHKQQVSNEMEQDTDVRLTKADRKIYRLLVKLDRWVYIWNGKFVQSVFHISNNSIEQLENLEEERIHIERKYLIHMDYFFQDFYQYRVNFFDTTKQKFLNHFGNLQEEQNPNNDQKFFQNKKFTQKEKKTSQDNFLNEEFQKDLPFNLHSCKQIDQISKQNQNSNDLEEGEMDVGQFFDSLSDLIGTNFQQESLENKEKKEKRSVFDQNLSNSTSQSGQKFSKIENSVQQDENEFVVFENFQSNSETTYSCDDEHRLDQIQSTKKEKKKIKRKQKQNERKTRQDKSTVKTKESPEMKLTKKALTKKGDKKREKKKSIKRETKIMTMNLRFRIEIWPLEQECILGYQIEIDKFDLSLLF